MTTGKALTAFWLAVSLSGCAQQHGTASAPGSGHDPPRTPVPTLGPDDGLPYASATQHAAHPVPRQPAAAAGDTVSGTATGQPARR